MGRPKEVTDQQIVQAARRCFLERGATVSAADIGRELGVSHTTLFNRFGSKEGLMLAALGPPTQIAWVAALEAGPDERPIRRQLIEHARAMAVYYRELQAGFALLQAAGIDPKRAVCERTQSPEHASRALTAWLERARDRGLIGECDVPTLATTILATLHGWALSKQTCNGGSTCAAASEQYVERFIDLLWEGVAPRR